MVSISIITKDTRIADAIHVNYLLLPVINRFGMNLGFGDKTIEQVCNDYNINVSFFLDIINTYHDSSYFPKEKMQEYPVNYIIDYLKETHRYYREKIIPETEQLLSKLIKSCKTNCDNLGMIDQFYRKYKEDLLEHLAHEEQKFFPYVLELSSKDKDDTNLFKIRDKYNFSYDLHSHEHEGVLDKLFDLKNIIIKYLPPDYDRDTGNNLLSLLFVFERDIMDHERLEDVILIPALRKIESQFNQ
jgi:regulator of cell morphogenesis and NO signaling